MKAIIYARQSSGDEEESLSIDAQIDTCKKLAQNNGFEVVGIHKDLNTSGTTYPVGSERFAEEDAEWTTYRTQNAHVQKRPYRKGLADALKHLPMNGYLLVSDSTRFARPLSNSFLANHLVQLLKSKSALVWSATEGKQDYDKADSKLIQTIREQIEFESKEKRRNASLEGKKRRKNNGASQGGLPYGYKFVRSGSYEPIHEEAQIVKRIYGDYLNGKGSYTIARELFNEKVPSKLGGIWCVNFIDRIIKNPIYMGMTRNSDGELIESVSFPAIVEKGIWFTASNKMESVKKVKGYRSKHQHYLNGLLYCGSCERNLCITGGAKGCDSQVYSCIRYSDHKRDRNSECSKSMSVEFIGRDKLGLKHENLKKFGIAEALYPLSILASYKSILKQVASSSGIERKITIANEITRLKRKKNELQSLWMKDVLALAEYEKLSKDFKEQLHILETELVTIKNLEFSEELKVETNWERLNDHIKNGQLEAGKMSELLHDVLKKVVVHPYSIDVLLFDDSSFTLERIPIRSSRCYPAWRLRTATVSMARGPGSFPKQFKLIEYFYKTAYEGDTTTKTIYKAKFIQIDAIGSNPMSRARKAKLSK